MTGLVIKNTGYWYTVLSDEGGTVDCKVKGNFRLKGIRSTNPVAVGDRVTIEVIGDGKKMMGDGCLKKQSANTKHPAPSTKRQTSNLQHQSPNTPTGWITEIADRRNYIIRKSTNLSKQSHILAANVDQAVLVVTVNYPETSTTFIDRFLASAEAYSVPVILVFNKTDLLSDDELRYEQMMMTLYETIGYKCLAVSALNGDGIAELKTLLQHKVTLFSGNSGVGKSTLLNAIIPNANLRTSEISDAHNTGMHTTTFSEMLPLGDDKEVIDDGCTPKQIANTPNMLDSTGQEGDGCTPKQTANTHHPTPITQSWVIDTPGVKGFGTFDMEPEEICSYFKEIFHFSKDCRFNNCTHTHEPGCAVLKAVEEHYISESRYNSYLSMLNDKEDGKYRAAY